MSESSVANRLLTPEELTRDICDAVEKHAKENGLADDKAVLLAMMAAQPYGLSSPVGTEMLDRHERAKRKAAQS